MARVKDLWHSTVLVNGPDGKKIPETRKTARHPDRGGNRLAKRWLACWVTPDGREQTKAFRKRWDAEQCAVRMETSEGGWCLVPKCGHEVVTAPPVLLCADHLEMAAAAAPPRRRAGTHDPLVYFMRNGSRIKIGWTTNLKARLSALSLPKDAVVLTIPGGPAEEDAMHQRFANVRVGWSEWFEATPELEAYIKREAAAQQQKKAA